jgi:hypothetical protein
LAERRSLSEPRIVAQKDDGRVASPNKRFGKDGVDVQKVIVIPADPIVGSQHKRLIIG